MEPLPGYAPELDPVEQVWAWIKNGPLANYCVPTSGSLITDAADRNCSLYSCNMRVLPGPEHRTTRSSRRIR